ncbi:MAG TPA: HupE/UreJ family protein [Candidatus Methylomirabilis sp.]|nr:HupE/UreJ family protein [Candidatus Methylomirabilis sp.]
MTASPPCRSPEISPKPAGCDSAGIGKARKSLAPASSRKTRHRLHRLASLLVALLCAGFLAASPPAAAHARIGSVSHAVVTVTGDTIDYYLDLPPPVLSLLHDNIGDDPNELTDYFRTELRVTTWDSDCPLTRLKPSPPLPSGNRIFELLFQCPRPIADLTINSSLFLDLDESHTQFARLAPPDSPKAVLHEAVLTASNEVFHVADVRTGGSASFERAWAFLMLGIEHLLTGYDHILFLLTVVVGISFIESLKAVTSFTLAHSITMALGFLGAVSLPDSVVEPLIAATVIYVAFENVMRANIRRRWMWTFFFGLIHGLGFVGALKQITVSRQELVLSLASFNVGIELGQLMILALAVLALRYVRGFPWFSAFNRSFSAGVGLLGFVWLGQRILAA